MMAADHKPFQYNPTRPQNEWNWPPPDGEAIVTRAIVHTVTWDGDRTLRKYDNGNRELRSTREVDGLDSHRAAAYAADLWLMEQGDGSRSR